MTGPGCVFGLRQCPGHELKTTSDQDNETYIGALKHSNQEEPRYDFRRQFRIMGTRR